MVGFLFKDMREIDYFDEMCEFSIAIQGSKQFESQNLIDFWGFRVLERCFRVLERCFRVLDGCFRVLEARFCNFLGVASAIPSVVARFRVSKRDFEC